MTDVALYVPLRARDGSVRGWTAVDAAQESVVLPYRWSLNPRGYAYRTVRRGGRRSSLLLHRALAGLDFGDGLEVDHRDRDTLNNRSSNLRVLTHAENHQNRAAAGNPGASSRYRGVSWDNDRSAWRAHATIAGRQHTIGRFPTEKEASRAASAWRAEHMPFAEEAA